ncbi:MAG TPA: hypothetical protein VHD83_01255 [Puia sp.]|nr:hypothetical protein [Puia sp.]
MKALFSIFILLFTGAASFCQAPKSSGASNSADLDKAMKMLEEQKKKMTPEQRAMLEKMGVDKTMQNVQQNVKMGEKTSPGMMQMRTDPDKIPDHVSQLKIAATPQNKAQLTAYLSGIFSETEKAIKPESKAAVRTLLNKGEKTGKYAMVYWANNELDKALYLLLDACITDADDMVSLNNIGSLLTISGYAHKSLPILLYAQKLLPNSGTILNNTGQAWLSLGNVDKAQLLLLAAIKKDTANSEAYRSLALIAQQQGNNALCIGYLEKSIAHGGATTQNINLLNKLDPGRDMSEYIRSRFKRYYKDHSITKRFIVPEIPGSYEALIQAYPDINKYFKNLDATIDAAYKAGRQLKKDYEKQLMDNQNKRMAQMQQIMNNAGKPGMAGSIQDMKASLVNPFGAQAAIMLSSIDNPQYSKSYYSRMRTESEGRLKSEMELKQSLKIDFDNKINDLVKEQGKLQGGEARSEENARLMQIEKELCSLSRERQIKWLGKIAEINNQFIRKIEELLNLRLQEYLFWNTIVMQQMQDPTPVNYQYYVSYLNDLRNFAYPLFAYNTDGGLSKPCGDYLQKDNTTRGKIQEWEREHCEVDFGLDAKVFGGKMNCEGFTIYADLKAGEFTYTRSIDPVTWETTGHSLSAKAGKDKEFELTKSMSAKIGASVETTIQFDRNMNPVDLIVEGSAGAEINGPMGGGASVDLGSVTVSVNGGFNASGPGFTPFGSSFLKN